LLKSGVYYFWIARTYPWGDIGRSITQWVYVGLNNHLCPQGDTAFPAKISNITRQPWGYTCSSSNYFDSETKEGFEIEKQLDLVRKAIDEQVQLHELSKLLLPLEEVAYWSESLHQLLEKYLTIERLSYDIGLKKKCEWLINFIREHGIDLHKAGLRFSVDSYARGSDWRVNVKMPFYSLDPKTAWVIQRISIKPKSSGSGRRIQRNDVVLYYPVFKEVIPNIEKIVNLLGISSEIIERWGSL